MKIFDQKITDTLISGGIGVIPTDTLYGLVGRAELPETVERIYVVRKRRINKPCILLISSIEDLKRFDIEVSSELMNLIKDRKIWPGKVSIIFPCPNSRFDYLARGTQSIAFRVPDIHELKELLKKTGPIVAPSANIEGETPSKTLESARLSFGDTVDFYVEGGELDDSPSTLIKFENGKIVVLRQGSVIVI